MRSYILEHISNNIFELVTAQLWLAVRAAKESFTSLSKYINEMERRLFKQAGDGMEIL